MISTHRLKILICTLSLLASFAVNSQTLPSYVPASGLVGWWSFSGNANDLSGNGHNGMVNGARLAPDRFGNANSSYLFNGTSNFIYVPATGVSNLNAFTVTAWLMYTGDNGGQPYDTYFQFGDRTSGPGGSGHSFGFGYNYNMRAFNNFQACKPSAFSAADITNSWRHVTVVHSGNVNTIYVDGVRIDSINGNNSVCYEGSSTLYFGACTADSQYVTGKMDDIGFWTRALTPAEIMQVYRAQSLSTPTAPTTADIKIYPNPVSNILYLKASRNLINEPYNIYDAAGRIVASGLVKQGNSINVSAFPKGMYLLSLPYSQKLPFRMIVQ